MESRIEDLGALEFPTFQGVRVMMLPFRLEDPAGTIPSFAESWRRAAAALVEMGPVREGVAYLTVDEAVVPAGQTHRRPGLHVDGIGPDGKAGGWSKGGYGYNGMLTAASAVGCRGWRGMFQGTPKPNGDCAHMAGECPADAAVVFQPGRVYLCSPLAVHEALPMKKTTARQFVRLSMPSDAPWYEGYTRNPLGIEPTGPIHAPRTEFMRYRA